MKKKKRTGRLTTAQREDMELLRRLPAESRDRMRSFALGMLAAGEAMKKKGRPAAG